MPNNGDANIKLLYAVDQGSFFTIDAVELGAAFDLIANVEIGEDIMKSVDDFDLRVSVINLSQSSVLATVARNEVLTDSTNPFTSEERVSIAGGWTADDGDVLEAVGSFKVNAGVNSDYSTQKTSTFMVAAP